MITTKHLAIAILSTMVCSFGASIGHAKTFDSRTFLGFPPSAQSNYIGTSAFTAAVIAAQNLPSQSRCIDDWISKSKPGGYLSVIKAMKKYPGDHPAGIILAVIQKACGSFKYLK